MFTIAVVAFALLWEGYKVVGPNDVGKVFGWRIIPRASDEAMPHIWEMLKRFGRPEVRGGNDRTVLDAVVAATWYSFRMALGGFVLGVVVGLALAVVMTRFRVVERGLLPYLILSQTVPLIALAPLTVSWGGHIHFLGFAFERWMSALVLGAFLAFFPVAIGALRGLAASPSASLELMDSYAASWRQTLWKVRFPSAVPMLVPALKLAASASVVGVVVAEISTGLKDGIGRLILAYGQEATGDAPKPYTAVFGAAVLGLAMAGVVVLIEKALMRNRPQEAA
jgi:NitT/TauT family transport system permease protein